MTLLEKVCEELGVNLDEEWEGSDGYNYIINESGKIFHDKNGVFLSASTPNGWERIMSGELHPKWKPSMYDAYWTIDFF